MVTPLPGLVSVPLTLAKRCSNGVNLLLATPRPAALLNCYSSNQGAGLRHKYAN